MPNFMEIFQAVTDFPRAQLNFQRQPFCVQLCIETLYQSLSGQLQWHIWSTFPLYFCDAVFTVSLLYRPKKVKNDQRLKTRVGSCLRRPIVRLFVFDINTVPKGIIGHHRVKMYQRQFSPKRETQSFASKTNFCAKSAPDIIYSCSFS